MRVECPERAQRVEGHLKCSTSTSHERIANTLYIGSTKNLFGRLQFHTLGVGATATKDKPGLRIVYTEKYSTLKDALRRERQLKKWSRAKKEALIRGDLTTLKRLSRSRQMLRQNRATQ